MTTAAIVLYGFDLSTYVAKVQVVLRYKGLRYELRPPPDGYNSVAYRKISPLGSIPSLVMGDVVISESEAIAEYLDERIPSPPMLPGDAEIRAHTRTLSRVHDTWVEPHLRALFPFVKEGRRDGVDTHIDNFHMRLSRLAEVSSPDPYLAGSELSIADCAWPTTLTQARQLFEHFDRPLELPASLLEWSAMLDEHPDVVAVRERCGIAMREWMGRFKAIDKPVKSID